MHVIKCTLESKLNFGRYKKTNHKLRKIIDRDKTYVTYCLQHNLITLVDAKTISYYEQAKETTNWKLINTQRLLEKEEARKKEKERLKKISLAEKQSKYNVIVKKDRYTKETATIVRSVLDPKHQEMINYIYSNPEKLNSAQVTGLERIGKDPVKLSHSQVMFLERTYQSYFM